MEERERMRRADEAATAQGRENNARGEHYHRGMAEIRRENRENGWVREYVEPSTNQRLDQARVYVNEELRAFREYKSGRIDGRSLEQLRKHKELLEKEVYRSGEWVSATPLAQAPGEFRDLVKQMREQLNFRFVVTPRELTERAMQLGRQLTPGVQQLELVSGYELHRRDRARKRLNNIRAIVQAREAKERTERETQERETQERERKQRERKELDARKRDIARVVGANSKAIAVAKADGASFPTRELRDAHSDVSRALEDVREKEQEQTREMLADLEFGGKSAHVMEEILAQGRERQRARLTTQIDALGKEATAREEADQLAAQEAEKNAQWREQRKRNQQARAQQVEEKTLSPEQARVVDLMDAGAAARPGGRPPPGMEEIPRLRVDREALGRERSPYRQR